MLSRVIWFLCGMNIHRCVCVCAHFFSWNHSCAVWANDSDGFDDVFYRCMDISLNWQEHLSRRFDELWARKVARTVQITHHDSQYTPISTVSSAIELIVGAINNARGSEIKKNGSIVDVLTSFRIQIGTCCVQIWQL